MATTIIYFLQLRCQLTSNGQARQSATKIKKQKPQLSSKQWLMWLLLRLNQLRWAMRTVPCIVEKRIDRKFSNDHSNSIFIVLVKYDALLNSASLNFILSSLAVIILLCISIVLWVSLYYPSNPIRNLSSRSHSFTQQILWVMSGSNLGTSVFLGTREPQK